MSFNSLMNSKTIFSVVILGCFLFNMVPNQAIYGNDIFTNESPLLVNETEETISRTVNYDLGIDSIVHDTHSEYFMGDCSSECDLLESSVPVNFRIKVTNYGSELVDKIVINLMLKTTADGLVQYDNTFSSEAFSDGPMHISETSPLETGDSIVFTFNRTNDRSQLIFDGENEYTARHAIFLLSGLSYIQATIIVEDDDASNNNLRKDVEVAKWIDNGEDYWEEIGPDSSIWDTDDNGANSLERVNIHRSTNFDHDADGCGWARECTENEGTDNISSALRGDSAYATFNTNGWFKEGADPSECDWDVFGDNNCPKFTSEPYQDDYIVSPPMDLSGMEDMSIEFAYRGNLQEGGFECNNGDFILFDFANDGSEDCDDGSDEPGNGYDFECYNDDSTISMEWVNDGYEDCDDGSDEGYIQTGDVVRLQASKDGWSWTNLWALTSSDNSWDWETFVLDEGVFEELAYFYGRDDTDSVYLRFQADSDGDNMTECNGSPCSIFFFDDIVIRGSGKVTRDVAVGDISVRGGDDMIVKDPEGNSLWREINATVINAGESPWSDLPVRFSVTNSQGDDMSDYLDYSEPSIWQLTGDSRYGDITAEGAEEQTELFVLFETPSSDAYHVMVETLAPYGKDFFPSNNSKTVKFCIFSDGDDDDDDCVGNSYDECPDTLDGEGVDEYGCSYSQKDNDSDGITNGIDNCPETPDGEEVDDYGCSASQNDTDIDGITDEMDECSDTPNDEEVDESGCSDSQKDTDIDGITDDMDGCSDTPNNEEVDESGCSASQRDTDIDGITEDMDVCPDTSSGEDVDESGCSDSQKDSDNDGITDDMDNCPETSEGEQVDEYGCSNPQKYSNCLSSDYDWCAAYDEVCLQSSEDNLSAAKKCGELSASFCDLPENIDFELCTVTISGCKNGTYDDGSEFTESDKVYCEAFLGEQVDDLGEENYDSGPELESLEEESEISSLGLVAAIFSIFAIALVRRD